MTSTSARRARAATARPPASESRPGTPLVGTRAGAPRLRRDAGREAVEFLRATLIPDTREAVRLLREFKGRLGYLALYAEFFPDRWKAAKSPCLPTREDRQEYRLYCGDEGWPHSPRELEFFGLVDRHLFPLPLWQIEDTTGMWARMPHVTEATAANWEEEDPEDFYPALQLAGALLNGDWMSPEQLCENLGGGARPFDPQPSKRNPSDEALRRVFSAARPPINHFFDAWAVMAGETGNATIDPGCVCGSCDGLFEWTSEDIKYLASQYAEKGEIMSRVSLLSRWIERSPAERIAAIIRLWNEAAALTPERGR